MEYNLQKWSQDAVHLKLTQKVLPSWSSDWAQAPNAGGSRFMPGRGTRSHMLQLKDLTYCPAKKKDPACCS